MNTDASSDQIQESLTANNKNSDLINNDNVISNEVPSSTQKNLTAKRNNAQASETNVPTRESFQTLDDSAYPPESEGNVTAIVAKVKYQGTNSQTCRKSKHLAGVAPVTTSSEFY
jgi:hypothetical protein